VISLAVNNKPVNKPFAVKKEKSSQFIKEFNSNKISSEFLEKCKKAGRLFNNDK